MTLDKDDLAAIAQMLIYAMDRNWDALEDYINDGGGEDEQEES